MHREHLRIVTEDAQVGEQALDVCFINSKGFGGNNASAYVLAPRLVEKMLRKRHGEAAFADYSQRRELTRAAAADYESRALKGQFDVIYNFGQDLIDDSQIDISADGVKVPGFAKPLAYKQDARYRDMLED